MRRCLTWSGASFVCEKGRGLDRQSSFYGWARTARDASYYCCCRYVKFGSHWSSLYYQYARTALPVYRPITSSDQNGLEHDSVALVLQIRAIDKKRLENKIGVVEKKVLQRIIRELHNIISITRFLPLSHFLI